MQWTNERFLRSVVQLCYHETRLDAQSKTVYFTGRQGRKSHDAPLDLGSWLEIPVSPLSFPFASGVELPSNSNKKLERAGDHSLAGFGRDTNNTYRRTVNVSVSSRRDADQDTGPRCRASRGL